MRYGVKAVSCVYVIYNAAPGQHLGKVRKVRKLTKPFSSFSRCDTLFLRSGFPKAGSQNKKGFARVSQGARSKLSEARHAVFKLDKLNATEEAHHTVRLRGVRNVGADRSNLTTKCGGGYVCPPPPHPLNIFALSFLIDLVFRACRQFG